VDFTNIGVIGAGQMGRGIAQVAAQSGLDVTLLDVDASVAAKGKDTIGRALAKLVEKGKIDGAARDAVLARIRDPRTRSQIRDELARERSERGWGSVVIGSTAHPDHAGFRGQPLDAVARRMNREPAEAALTLMDKDALGTGAFFFGMSETNLWRILAEPWVMIGSDASLRAPWGVLSRDYPHPRAYGAFSRFLRAALDGRTVPVPEAIRKMSGLPAAQFRLADRGVIRRGAAADLLVLDPARLRDRADYGNPHALAEGVDFVCVNGVSTLEGGALTGARAGRVL